MFARGRVSWEDSRRHDQAHRLYRACRGRVAAEVSPTRRDFPLLVLARFRAERARLRLMGGGYAEAA